MELVGYLLDANAPVCRVIVANDADQEILELAAAHQVRTDVYTKDTHPQLVEEGRHYEWILNLWSPHILRPPVLALATRRLNVHPTLVPHCRGNDGAAWAIRKGLPTGVSLIEMDEAVDTGEVYAQREVPFDFPMRGKELHSMLQRELVTLFKDTWPSIHCGQVVPKPQEGPVSYHTRKETEKDRAQDAKTVFALEDCLSWILAHDFYPGTTAEVRHLGRTYKLTLNIEERTDGR